MRRKCLFALCSALGCATPQPPNAPTSTPGGEVTQPDPPDPCEAAVAFETVASDTEAALQAHSSDRYIELATHLRDAATCDGSVEAQSRRGRLLAAMGDDLFASEPEAARALFREGFEVLSALAEQLDDPAKAAEAARLQYDLLDRALYHEPHQPLAPTRRSCKVTSVGECPYLPKDQPPKTYPYSEDEADELRAYEVYTRFGNDPDRVRDAQYMRFRLLAEHRELGSELASLEAFIEQHDGHPLAAWAAFMLLDELAIRVSESEQPSVTDLEAIVRWIERLETMALWKLESAKDLQYMTPTLRAGAVWRLALEAREQGRYGDCADRFLALYEQYPNHDRAAELLSNASACLEAGGRIDEANRVRKQLRKQFPDADVTKALP